MAAFTASVSALTPTSAIANIEFEQFPEFAEAIADGQFPIDPVTGPYIAGMSGIDIADDGTMTNAWQVWGPWNTDLMRIGWGESDGWIFNTSYNTERATGTVGMFARDQDYMFIWNRKSIEDAVAAGNYVTSTQAPDVPVVSYADIEVYAVKVPLNPHGVDVSPTGRYMFIGGKATSLVDVVDWDKVQVAIDEQRFEGEEFGVPILETDFVKAASMDWASAQRTSTSMIVDTRTSPSSWTPTSSGFHSARRTRRQHSKTPWEVAEGDSGSLRGRTPDGARRR